jgi:hypothetical protein
VIGGRAGVDDDGLVGADEFGAGAADGFLFRQLMGVARGEGEFIGMRVDQARPAVHPAQTPADSSAATSRRTVETEALPPRCASSSNDANSTLIQVILDSFLTRFWLHLIGFWNILEYFARNMLTNLAFFCEYLTSRTWLPC